MFPLFNGRFYRSIAHLTSKTSLFHSGGNNGEPQRRHRRIILNKMNCPNCGSQTKADQHFCRECGASLAEGEKRSFNPRAWGLLILILLFGGLMITMTGKMLDLRWLAFTGFFIIIGSLFSAAALSLWRQTRPRKRKTVSSPQPESFERADTTNKLFPLGANDDFIPSVTEPTTELLKTPRPIRSSFRD